MKYVKKNTQVDENWGFTVCPQEPPHLRTIAVWPPWPAIECIVCHPHCTSSGRLLHKKNRKKMHKITLAIRLRLCARSASHRKCRCQVQHVNIGRFAYESPVSTRIGRRRARMSRSKSHQTASFFRVEKIITEILAEYRNASCLSERRNSSPKSNKKSAAKDARK